MKIPLCKRDEAGLHKVDIITLVALVPILVCLYILIANYKPYPRRLECASNLKQVGMAMSLFSGDNNDKFPSQVLLTNQGDFERLGNNLPKYLFAAMSNELAGTKVLRCPLDSRKVASDFKTLQTTNISYFMALDASEELPYSILLGDRNLQLTGTDVKPGILMLYSNSAVTWSTSIHKDVGNLELVDGSVQLVTVPRLQKFVSNQGLPTNRLVFP